jgi:hypothetical protein
MGDRSRPCVTRPSTDNPRHFVRWVRPLRCRQNPLRRLLQRGAAGAHGILRGQLAHHAILHGHVPDVRSVDVVAAGATVRLLKRIVRGFQRGAAGADRVVVGQLRLQLAQRRVDTDDMRPLQGSLRADGHQCGGPAVVWKYLSSSP